MRKKKKLSELKVAGLTSKQMHQLAYCIDSSMLVIKLVQGPRQVGDQQEEGFARYKKQSLPKRIDNTLQKNAYLELQNCTTYVTWSMGGFASLNHG
jgi:hypothetical protein